MSDTFKKITVEIMKEAFDKVGGNMRQFYRLMSSLVKCEMKSVKMTSLYWRAKRAIKEMERLKKFSDKERYLSFCKSYFQFPKSVQSRAKLTKVTKNVAKMESDKIIAKQNKTIEHLNYQLTKLKEKLRKIGVNRLNEKLKLKDLTIRRLKENIDNLKCIITGNSKKHEVKVLADKGVQCNTIKSVINDLKNEIDSLKIEIDENNNDGDDDNISKILHFRETSKGRPYCAKLRELYYAFRSRNISLQHIDPIIRAVLAIVDLEIEELPSITMAAKLTSELGIISRKQLSEELGNTENLTMHRDATTKKGKHFYAVQFTDSNATYTAGVREIHNEKAETYVSATNEILKDISDNSGSHNSKILCNVTNFMTDRSATEQKANKLLTSKRDLILNEKGLKKPANYFKCSDHPLLQFSEVCAKAVLDFEKQKNVQFDVKKNFESYSYFLIRCVSKLFYKDGSGEPLLAVVYLQSKNILDIPICDLKHTRFNSIFYNAAGIYYLRDHLLQFLQSSKASLNFIQNFIVNSLQSNIILSVIRALGIIFKSITEPYWQMSRKHVEKAVKMGPVYRRLTNFLHHCSENSELLLNDRIKMFPGPCLPHDEVSRELYKTSPPTDSNTRSLLKIFCSSLEVKCKSLFKDFLEGGPYYDICEDDLQYSETCPTNNISVERTMAQLDSSLKSGPSTDTSSIESMVMFKNNKTEKWLHNKSTDEKQNLITTAMKENQEFHKTLKRRKTELFQKHVETIKERQKLVENKKQRKEQQLHSAEADIKLYGIWESKDKIDAELEKFKTKKDKVAAVKKQISLYKTHFSTSSEEKHLLLFSSKGKQYDLERLISNLVKLIENRNMRSTTRCIPSNWVGKFITHIWTDQDNGQDTEWNGKILSHKKGSYEVIYWQEEEGENDDVFSLSKEELEKDFTDGNLFIKSTTETKLT